MMCHYFWCIVFSWRCHYDIMMWEYKLLPFHFRNRRTIKSHVHRVEEMYESQGRGSKSYQRVRGAKEWPGVQSLSRKGCRGFQLEWVSFITCGFPFEIEAFCGNMSIWALFSTGKAKWIIWVFLFCFINVKMSCFDRDRIVISVISKCLTSSCSFYFIFY